MDQLKSRSPLKAKPLRVAGQSVDEQRDKLLSDVYEQWALVALFMVLMAGMEWYRYALDMKPSPWTFTVAALAMSAFAAWRIKRVMPLVRNLKQARDGERAVGQFLEALRSQGYQVFHDLVGTGFNVDHVVLGPAGVFTIETKTWSKPARGRPEIDFDGERVKAAGREPDRDPVVQARAQANWVRNLLMESAGKQAFVKPVVVFPGWFIVNANGAMKDVWVLEPKALPAFLANEPIRISEADVRLFAFHISRFIRAGE
jgi:hypothetical protein